MPALEPSRVRALMRRLYHCDESIAAPAGATPGEKGSHAASPADPPDGYAAYRAAGHPSPDLPSAPDRER